MRDVCRQRLRRGELPKSCTCVCVCVRQNVIRNSFYYIYTHFHLLFCLIGEICFAVILLSLGQQIYASGSVGV